MTWDFEWHLSLEEIEWNETIRLEDRSFFICIQTELSVTILRIYFTSSTLSYFSAFLTSTYQLQVLHVANTGEVLKVSSEDV